MRVKGRGWIIAVELRLTERMGEMGMVKIGWGSSDQQELERIRLRVKRWGWDGPDGGKVG
jgi:hypothetical protein